jgi:hypothetical protein
MVGKTGNVDQVATLTDSLFVTEDEVELAVKDQSKLFFVRMHVERGTFVFRLTIPAFTNSPTALCTNCFGFAVLGFCCISAIL